MGGFVSIQMGFCAGEDEDGLGVALLRVDGVWCWRV
jgi:hypothetical protein